MVNPRVELGIGPGGIIVEDQRAGRFQSFQQTQQRGACVDGMRVITKLLGDACAKPPQ
ncbi:hypothetical protein D3C85_1154060 [compost metagenome]